MKKEIFLRELIEKTGDLVIADKQNDKLFYINSKNKMIGGVINKRDLKRRGWF